MSHYATEAPHASLIPIGRDFAFVSSFDRNLVDAFKRKIPPEARSWDKANRRWLVSAQYAVVCAELAESYLGVKIRVPMIPSRPLMETRLIRLEYLGRTKEREDGSNSAYGYADGDWSVVIPETVLRDWFSAVPLRPDEAPTLYAVLTIKETATLEEIRNSYRRLAKSYHPDVCREPDAAEMFKAVNHAYTILSDKQKRAKYTAGLLLVKQSARNSHGYDYRQVNQNSGFKPPLRCGYVLCEGTYVLGRFVVSKTMAWEDITDNQGRTLVTSWPMGSNHFTSQWV